MNGGRKGELLTVKALSFSLILFEGLETGVGGRPAIQDILLYQLLSRAQFFNSSFLVRCYQCLYIARLTCIAHTFFFPCMIFHTYAH